ncbi:MAG TPA: type II toxin-antitoxin system VapC family toxin [Thermomicrobiales bacterium]|nr:type II toxin-antitoxin system VapC family toxin [Thermomicrobiales bacterium]
MIIVDTNVVSEIMEDRPNATVLEWIDSIDQEVLWTTTISLAELVSGINRLPEGRRRAGLDANLWQVLASSFSGRILAFDQAAAMAYGTIVPIRLSRGRPISIPDAQIAAIAMSHDATLATRNVKDFEGTGVALVNPWDVPDAPQAGAGGRSCTADGCNWNTGRWFDIARHTARTGLVCPDPRSSDFHLFGRQFRVSRSPGLFSGAKPPFEYVDRYILPASCTS